MKSLRTSLTVLAVILLALIAAYVCSVRAELAWEDIFLNVGTEVLGILLTVLLIDAVIRKNERSERERVVKIAFVQMSLPLRRHVAMLLGMYKAAVAHAPQSPPEKLSTLFGPDYSVQLAFLDFAKTAPLLNVHNAQPISWFDYFGHEIEPFKAALTRTIEKYATFLDPETVDLLETLIASNFLAFLSQASNISSLDRKNGVTRPYNLLSGQGVADLIGQHTHLVQRMTELANEHLPKDKLIAIKAESWRNDFAPRFGSARL